MPNVMAALPNTGGTHCSTSQFGWRQLHCVSKTPHLYNLLLFLHNFFGTNVAEKADNQNVLYFPTSPN